MTQTKDKTWLVGGDEHKLGVCDSCTNKGAVAHIGYKDGSLGSYVYHCIECINAGRTQEHYEKFEFTPTLTQGARAVLKIPSPVGAAQVAELDSEVESVVESSPVESNSAKSAVGADMKNAKKGTLSKSKNTKPVNAVVEAPTSPIEGKFTRNKELPSGKIRFGVTDKDASVQGSIYIPGDLIPEGCSDIFVTIVCKEN
jgi:hypothetical protein